MNKKLMAVAVAGAIGAPGLAFAQAANVSVYGHLDGNLRTTKFSASGTPARIDPSAGSERMSERLRRASTKNGPSVCAGVTTHDGREALGGAAAELRAACPPRKVAPAAPIRVSMSRRLSLLAASLSWSFTVLPL